MGALGPRTGLKGLLEGANGPIRSPLAPNPRTPTPRRAVFDGPGGVVSLGPRHPRADPRFQ